MARLPLDNLLAELEAPAPSAAGGSAAAAAAAIAASLVVMVGRGSADWAEGGAAAAAAIELRDRLLVLGGEDADAVAGLIGALRAERSGEGDRVELDSARLRAVRIPLEIAEDAAEVTALARDAARSGKEPMRPDGDAAAALAETAARVAVSIAQLNLSAFPADDARPEVAVLRASLRAVPAKLGGEGG
jgi:formiminotetrahydrofolate cyclodeaminase